ncbi:diguanylate cyclase/phosphodiesterase (GGDEF & EAL domains) with PAS/PAC sensor(s) [Pseudoalteromonas sp. JB197]|nr:diguanylate cyclase/phosphodiesterase (GGDEF & EAL domains) with PAS/PAC sensor(s) [Pseudoalteromonas sp. JB197]
MTPAQHSALFAAQQQIIEQIALGVEYTCACILSARKLKQ